MSALPAEVATQETPASSPSGKYVLAVVAGKQSGNETQSFQILGQNKELLYASSDQFMARDVTFFLWDADDRVWVYSGDLGTFFWEEEGEPGTWKKSVYAQSDVSAPQFLKQVRPRWHPR
jgi:hypothetical protein